MTLFEIVGGSILLRYTLGMALVIITVLALTFPIPSVLLGRTSELARVYGSENKVVLKGQVRLLTQGLAEKMVACTTKPCLSLGELKRALENHKERAYALHNARRTVLEDDLVNRKEYERLSDTLTTDDFIEKHLRPYDTVKLSLSVALDIERITLEENIDFCQEGMCKSAPAYRQLSKCLNSVLCELDAEFAYGNEKHLACAFAIGAEDIKCKELFDAFIDDGMSRTLREYVKS